MNTFIRQYTEASISVKIKTEGVRKTSTLLCKTKEDVEKILFRLPKECSVKKIILPQGGER